MKKILIVLMFLSMGFSVFANTEDDLRNTAKDAVSTLSKNSKVGSGYLGLTFDAFGANNILLTSNFKVIGPWAGELSFGYSLASSGLAIELDIVNFVWDIPLSDSIYFGVGFGCPFTSTIGMGGEGVFGFKPTADLRLTFQDPYEDVGFALFLRPGYLLDFTGNSNFSATIGIMMSLESSIISEAILSAL